MLAYLFLKQKQAWILTLAALLAIVICLRVLNSESLQQFSVAKDQRYIRKKASVFQYVIRNLFSQGNA